MDVDVRPDARRTLPQLQQQWSSCTKCELGQRRVVMEGQFVFGQGVLNSIMFIGEGPGIEEERKGEPFIDKSGELLRKVLTMLGLKDYYLTNLVSCRSCAPLLDPQGLPVQRRNYQTKLMEPAFKDEPPTPPQCLACAPRLYEEIYLVDPVIIVGLGPKACEQLLGRSVTITRERGEATQISVPGASYNPVLTEKKQEWLRRLNGQLIQPTEQNKVLYHFIPTLHPSYVIRKLMDRGADSPFRQFAQDIRKALRTYESYLELVFNMTPQQRSDVDDDVMQSSIQTDPEE